jgi:hypothetical protein
MGTLYKNIDDINILKTLFPKQWDIDEAKDTDIYGDGRQAGTAYYLQNKTYLLVPIHSKQIVKTIIGEEERDCIAWDVQVAIWIPSHDRMQPDEYDDKELILNASFEEAVTRINEDMFRCEVMNCMENLDYENTEIEEELNPRDY